MSTDHQQETARAYDEAGKAAGKATMYGLAECARAEHPSAIEVVLSESDQGSWLWVDHVVTQEDDLARIEDAVLDDDDGLASCLYSDIYTLRELYSEFDVRGEIEYGRREGITSFRMDVAKVLAECKPPEPIDVRKETGVETYVNDEPGDPNPGIIVDSTENRGRALTSAQARALAAELNAQADHFDSIQKEEK